MAVMKFLLLYPIWFLTYFKISTTSNPEFQNEEYGKAYSNAWEESI